MEGQNWLQSVLETPWSRRALMITGGAAATAGLMYYLFMDDEEDVASPSNKAGGGAAAKGMGMGPGSMGARAAAGGSDQGMWFAVTDTKGRAIGVRELPDINSTRTGQQVLPGERFRVVDIRPGDGEQLYLRLADGRGWVFTHSGQDGRRLCTPISAEEAAKPAQMHPDAMGNMMEALMRDPQKMEAVMKEAQQHMASNPELMQQWMRNQAMHTAMQDPENVKRAQGLSAQLAEQMQADAPPADEMTHCKSFNVGGGP